MASPHDQASLRPLRAYRCKFGDELQRLQQELDHRVEAVQQNIPVRLLLQLLECLYSSAVQGGSISSVISIVGRYRHRYIRWGLQQQPSQLVPTRDTTIPRGTPSQHLKLARSFAVWSTTLNPERRCPVMHALPIAAATAKSALARAWRLATPTT